MLEELKKIHFARFRLELESIDPLRLPPYKGSTFRGAFGNTFKRLVCVKRDRECGSCLIGDRCVYSYVFETPARAAEGSRNYAFAPHPFVIEPPEETKELYASGETLSVGLVLVGRAVEYLPYFIYAFDEMGQQGLGQGRGQARLSQVFAVNLQGERCIYWAEEGRLDADYPVRAGPVSTNGPANQVRLRLITPTRLKEGGQLTDELDFPLLVRSLLRRSADLAQFHCGAELDLDYRGLIEQAGQVRRTRAELRWRDWERYSHRQGQKMKLGGLVGQVEFAGQVEPFWPLLHLGAELHVGKGTGFGLGRYEII